MPMSERENDFWVASGSTCTPECRDEAAAHVHRTSLWSGRNTVEQIAFRCVESASSYVRYL